MIINNSLRDGRLLRAIVMQESCGKRHRPSRQLDLEDTHKSHAMYNSRVYTGQNPAVPVINKSREDQRFCALTSSF